MRISGGPPGSAGGISQQELANALLVAYNPNTAGLGFAGLDLLIVAGWGAAGLVIALRTFSWQPLGR